MTGPPGPTFLLCNLNVIVTPPTVALSAFYALNKIWDVVLPAWLLFVASVLSFAVAFFALRVWRAYNNKSKAAALGAMLPPLVDLSDRDAKISGEDKYPRKGHAFVTYC